MYRIELAPGEETAFRTIEELAIAVRNGLVTARARIYHNASQKWLPIEFHPHYKKALELRLSRSDLPPARPPERAQPLSFATARPGTAEVPPSPAVIAPPTPPEKRTVELPVETAAATPVFLADSRPGVSSREPFVPRRSYAPPEPPSTPTPAPVTHLVTTREFQAVAVVAEEDAGDAHAGAAARRLPPVMASPVLQLPTISYPSISYPEITPAEPATTAGASGESRSRRPLHLAGLVALLSVGGYAMMSAFSPARGEAAPARTTADRPALPPAQPDSIAGAGDPMPPAVERPAPITMNLPASSGFAPALEPRAIVSTSSAKPAATDAPADSSIVPATIEVDLAVPTLSGADLLTPATRTQSDSAMKRILRAVTGGKDVPQRP
ncbi:MAG TPA: hypothetical protein VMY76_01905 [Gemmatimonadales bacterium]|nr:hypothetical protein [Gemmatimonadales bacterium]